MKKIALIAPLLLMGMSQAMAKTWPDFFLISLWDDAPAKSTIEITFSGYCSGKITSTVDSVGVNVSSDPSQADSYADIEATDWGGMSINNSFHGQSIGNETHINIKKGIMSLALQDKSTFDAGEDFGKIHDTGADTAVFCKNNSTLNSWLSSQSLTTHFVDDGTLKNNVSFTLKGSEAPFPYKFSKTITGYLLLPTTCTESGAYTGDMSSDTFQSNCKLTNKVKVKITVKAEGKMDYAT